MRRPDSWEMDYEVNQAHADGHPHADGDLFRLRSGDEAV